MDNQNRKTVQILGKDYQISCSPEEAEGLGAAAAYLDKMMRDMRGRVVGLERIAIMAALNITYQMMNQSDTQTAIGPYEHRIQIMQQKIDAAIAALATSATHKTKYVAESDFLG